jgi:hypothetical protein
MIYFANMARLCLPKNKRDKLLEAFKQEDITIRKLYQMSSEELNTLFGEYVGKSFAPTVTAKFETAMLSKQKDAFVKFFKQATEYQEPIRRSMLRRVERNKRFLTTDEMGRFFQEAASERLGVSVTEAEAQTIIDLKRTVDDTETRIPQDYREKAKTEGYVGAKDIPEEAFEYGVAMRSFEKYVEDLKTDTRIISKEEFKANPFLATLRASKELLGLSRALLSSWDLGLMGRQAWPLLLRGNVKQWGQQVVDGFRIFGAELKAEMPNLLSTKQVDSGVIDLVRAEIYAQPHYIEGYYTASKNKYGLDVLREEPFPVDYAERIPLFRGVYKASQSAYSGASLLMRARFASQQIQFHQSRGIDLLDETNATALGSFVGTLTGRAPLPNQIAPMADTLNKVFFAPRLMMSRFNILTGSQLDPNMAPFLRKDAAVSTLRMALSLTGLLTMAKMLGADADTDPRSSTFGTIKMGNSRIDVTGGIKGYVTLGMKFMPSYLDGELGWGWYKTRTGKWQQAWNDTYGSPDLVDTMVNFMQGRFAPVPSEVAQWMRGRTYSGEKPTPFGTLTSLVTPISLQNITEEFKKGNDQMMLSVLAENFGFSPTPTTLFLTGKRWEAYREKFGDRKFYEANLQITEAYNKKVESLQNSSRWERLSNADRSKELDKIRREETDRVLRRGGIK